MDFEAEVARHYTQTEPTRTVLDGSARQERSTWFLVHLFARGWLVCPSHLARRYLRFPPERARCKEIIQLQLRRRPPVQDPSTISGANRVGAKPG